MEILTDNSTQESKSEPSENKATHKRAYWVEKTRKALGTKENGETYSFGQVNGLTSNWTVNKIKRRFNECKKADIPFAPLWHWKRNQEK